MVELPNWSESVAYSADAIRRPSSIDEVREIVAGADRVKALGTRHCFSAIADTPGGVLVALDAIDPGIVVDAERQTAWVSGGTSYGVLARELAERGYGLANMASLPHISVAGGTATPTHGSGDDNGMLATSIGAVELVKADGSLAVVERSHADLAALAMGLGAFGIITRLRVDIQPDYRMRQDLYAGLSWESVLDSFDEVMASAYSVSLMVAYSEPAIRLIWQKQRLDTELSPAPSSYHSGTWVDDSALPAVNKYTERAGVPGRSADRLAHFKMEAEPSLGGDELQSEYFVPRRHGVAALQALRDLGDRIDPHLWGSEIRTVAADDLWMSPAHGRASLCFGFTWRKHRDEVLALLPDIEAALAPFEARPHWGKLFHSPELADRFPRWHDFFRLVDRYDPNGKFSNPFLDRLRPS